MPSNYTSYKGNVYTIREQIAWGGEGAEFLASPLSTQQLVKIELRPKGRSVISENIKDLMKKYGIPLIDEGETGDWHFFVFDYVEGKTLDKLQRERGALPVADALKITEQIAESLEHIHSK